MSKDTDRHLIKSLVLAVLSAWFLPGTCRGAIREIGPGVFAEEEPFERVANSLKPGDELVLRDGVYSQTGRRAVTVKGTPAAPIVIRAAQGARPVLTRPVEDMDRHNNIEFVDCSHMVVRGIVFAGGSCGIRFIRGDHVTLEDCEIRETGNNALTMNSGSCDAFIIRRNHIHHTGLSTRRPTEGEGMYIGSHDGKYITTNSLIEGNWIHHTRSTSGGGNDGIEIKFGSYGNTVRDNVIHDTTIGTQYPGIFVYGGGRGVNVVEGNLIMRAGEGIQVVSDAVIRNNIIIDCTATGITAGPHAAVPHVRNVQIINNTIVNHPRGVRIRWGGAEAMVFANNAVYCEGRTAIDAAGLDKALVSSNYVSGGLNGAMLDGRQFAAGGTLAEAFRTTEDLRPHEQSVLIGRADAAYVPAYDFEYHVRTAPFDVGACALTPTTARQQPLKEGFKKQRDDIRRNGQ
ncbi:MAG: right-handed parallel beta-helix repeat-containing protein [Phycisphaerae bacterium]|nr:right-handed parallel beta-helix repeat-containing protein [Phycisphaerae bacterium]